MDSTTPSPEYSLTMDQCWALLDTEVVGRVALIVDNHPEIFPVNFVLERRAIAFRTAGGTKLWGAITGKPVAFEIDGYDARDETAWSVMARGEAEVIESQEEKDEVDSLLLEPWQPGEQGLLRACGSQSPDRTTLQGQPARCVDHPALGSAPGHVRIGLLRAGLRRQSCSGEWTTSTGQCACATQAELTDPRSSPPNPAVAAAAHHEHVRGLCSPR